jgi:hypothetical protein
MEKQTPKQRVLAVYPNAVAVKIDAKTVMSTPTWAILEENDENARTLGDNGSANGAWKNAAEQLPSSGRSEYDDPVIGLDVTYPGGPPPVVFGPNDYIENGEHVVIGVDPALPGSEKTLLTRLDARDPAFLRAMGRNNGMSKLRNDSGGGRASGYKVRRQAERKAGRDLRIRFRGLNTPQAHNLPNANPFYPPRKRNVFSPGVLKALAPFGKPKSKYANQMRSLVLEKGYSVGMK